MQLSISFIRILFLGLCILFLTTYTASRNSGEVDFIRITWGIGAGLALGCAIISLDKLLKKFPLRAFNTATIGLLFGYLMGEAIFLIFQTILDTAYFNLSSSSLALLRMSTFLLTSYLGMIMTARAADELYISIPFIKFKSTTQKKKDLLLDSSVLFDLRIIDLASSGLFDHHLIIPQFIVKELSELSEHSDEPTRLRARKGIDVIKKLENIISLDLRYADLDFPEIKDPFIKLVRIARLLETNILIADANRTQQPSIEGVRIINIHSLSSALKPLAQAGECIHIKIQRYGKEPRQGVGYLDDGTMVVVNGGAEYIGEGIRAQVLSVKHTASGRMIFCNAVEENAYVDPSLNPVSAESEGAPKAFMHYS